jgi:glycosyltransferase involved in cell wall biosynthesis
LSDRIVFDISSLIRWAAPPVGLIRVERELAGWARRNLLGVEFACFDRLTRSFRRVEHKWLDLILAGNVVVHGVPKATALRTSIPAPIRAAWKRIGHPHRDLFLAAERLRLTSTNPRIADFAGWLQRPLLGSRIWRRAIDEDGQRRAVLAYRQVLGPQVAFDRNSILVAAGATWIGLDVGLLAALKQRCGIALASFCADIIPLQFPHFYPADGVAKFRALVEKAFPLTDLTVLSARRVEEDVRAYCRQHGIALGRTLVLPLGADAVARTRPTGHLPQGLEAGCYALFVSTVEPRKGHALLYRVWRRLLAEGIPQQTGFRLAFVGRRGWMVDDLLRRIESDREADGTLLLLGKVSDAQLATLYENAAFCLYPSVYEGFGLPLVEAFLRKKAVIASNGGAIPEVVGDLSPCLDPHDEEAWYATLKEWILDPSLRRPYERALGTEYRPTTWDEFARRFFAAARSVRSELLEPSSALLLAERNQQRGRRARVARDDGHRHDGQHEREHQEYLVREV